ncbi:MAG: hypothetical protein JWO89_1212, partial [Verrucomicrobiaceae bacterium]|nr:hypothetical protein [Verrucomicrobiaceae bacterium]
QKEMAQVMDVSDQTGATTKLYGLEDTATAGFGHKCVLARRMMEAGVRFVEVSHGDWDQHLNLSKALGANCASVDQPIAALLTDLKQRGLLKDTLVISGGEFGRTPHAQGRWTRPQQQSLHHVDGWRRSKRWLCPRPPR